MFQIPHRSINGPITVIGLQSSVTIVLPKQNKKNKKHNSDKRKNYYSGTYMGLPVEKLFWNHCIQEKGDILLSYTMYYNTAVKHK